MIFAVPDKRAIDWFAIDPDLAKSIGETPGVRFDDRYAQWLVHRSHLPLLNLPAPQSPSELPASSSFGDNTTTLKPHQQVGVEFIRSRRGTLLADAMRTGKTATIIASHEPDSGRLVVVGPLQTRHVWLGWMRRRWPDKEPIVITGRSYDPEDIDPAELIFIHYDVLSAWVSIGVRRKIGTLVFDEAHLLSHRNSLRSTAACTMSPVAHRVVCATGTPLWNAPESFYGILRTCNPGAWGTYFQFTERHASGHPGAHGWETGEPSNVDELKIRLSEVMLRRTWADIESSVPEIKRSAIKVEISSDTRRDLDVVAADLGSATDEPTVVGELARYRSLLAVAKAEQAADHAYQLSKTGPVVVWVWHRKASKAIKAVLNYHLVQSWIVDGSIGDVDERDQILDQWRASPNGVLLMSISVGQAGIDLSRAYRAIFAELDWTPAVIGQAEMRTFSPARDSEITYIVADHDIDEKLAAVLGKKCAQALVMGVPAADTAIEVLGQILGSNEPSGADLGGLAARIAGKVQVEGTTLS